MKKGIFMKKIVYKFLIRSSVLLLVNLGINLYFKAEPNWYTAISTALSVPLGLAVIEFSVRQKPKI